MLTSWNICSELCDEQEINDIANMSIDKGLKYLKYIFEMYDIAVEADYSNVIITRSMQTLFTIHALIYDKKDVKQWWISYRHRTKIHSNMS